MCGAIGKGWNSSPSENGRFSKLLGTQVLSTIAVRKIRRTCPQPARQPLCSLSAYMQCVRNARTASHCQLPAAAQGNPPKATASHCTNTLPVETHARCTAEFQPINYMLYSNCQYATHASSSPACRAHSKHTLCAVPFQYSSRNTRAVLVVSKPALLEIKAANTNVNSVVLLQPDNDRG